ncbi:prefoldin, alpha subunit [Methanococcus vannielii SB]|jgi:prefoldin alpha subunit|uniref:Prefoldin subunit alpha n=1 Tax=Methanococcus vannielii (strain ATCC 35089 / DSM 1224 / JCM 13029 / OCM 148 / SB) TaxID=406327 RepID=PFDA_METVS|nr:prefoldin subunit alpha [Methanococcus vannielii]A6UQB4.1 RecName: Full=Prefoldin subunit alpha; AltName: Full=GimC subunit alpha [Methanococcus vannielii SB]ABR54686.1 prefoldin, alpha subunit [Methanococcus vannielii SB]
MNEELQNQFMALDVYNQQVQKLQEELSNIDLMIMELVRAIESMESLKTSGEIMLPLGAGSFVKADVKNPEKIILSVGVDVLLEKDVEEVILDFKNSLDELEKTKELITTQIQKTSKEVTRIRGELEKRAAAIEKQSQTKRGHSGSN